ncbi:Os07g0260000 [Oryza sativa Japonica Group]|uniref:Os07g0260000 protein n=1 Tax=Oryza sativa subsp. japonica TaxID=39947 RepID=A0A0P0X4B2_ORYSJ|nr:hypothetical protein EE612_038323 [Oryza sativa]BAT00891.1 Os07g0260000 [Oryza sativa Japonica Group]
MEQALLRILRTLGSTAHLTQAHARLLAAGLAASPRLLPALVAAAFSAHSPRYAAAALRAAGPAASTVSHNTLVERLAGARPRGRRPAPAPAPADALAAYAAMRAQGVPPNGGDVEAARSVFDRMDQKDVVSWTAMVSAYAKIGDLDTVNELFDHMPVKNLVSWNAMITGYNHNSRYDEALRTFQLMMLEGRFRPDEATLVSVVSACAQLGSVEYCNWISSFIGKSNIHLTVALGNALIDMFAKCGDVGRAESIFYKMETRCIITWTTMISGFAFNGLCRDALLVYNNMCREGVQLDDTVFIAALAACAHGGLLQEGWSIFNEMVERYNIQPRMEHYGCMVDLLGRAGNLQEAILFIESMPLEPSVVIWVTLLCSCVAHGNAELIEYVSKKITELEPFNSSYQVLVSNCSALEGRWDGVIDARTSMRNWGIEKVPGSSSIQVGSEVHEFLAKDTRHKRRKEIYETVDGLMALMRHTEQAHWVR